MKQILIVFLVLLFVFSSAAFAGSICKFLPLTNLMKQSLSAEGKTVSDMENELPTAEQINIPIYPGAYCGMGGESNGELSMFQFLSKDSSEKVVSWYKAKLGDNWQYAPELAIEDMKQIAIFINTKKKNVSAMDALKYRQFAVSKVEKKDDTGFIGMSFDVSGIKSLVSMTLKPMM